MEGLRYTEVIACCTCYIMYAQARLNFQQMLVCICGVFTDNSNGV